MSDQQTLVSEMCTTHGIKPGIHCTYSIFLLYLLCLSCPCIWGPKVALHTHKGTLHPLLFLKGTAHGIAPKLRLQLTASTEMKEEGLHRWAPSSAGKQTARNLFLKPFSAVICCLIHMQIASSPLSSRVSVRAPNASKRGFGLCARVKVWTLCRHNLHQPEAVQRALLHIM